MLIWGCSDSKGQIWLINKASNKIIRAQVDVCDQTLIFKDLEISERQNGFFLVKGECHYAIEVLFSNQSTLVKDLGYVTTGFDYIDYLIVADEEIFLNPFCFCLLQYSILF